MADALYSIKIFKNSIVAGSVVCLINFSRDYLPDRRGSRSVTHDTVIYIEEDSILKSVEIGKYIDEKFKFGNNIEEDGFETLNVNNIKTFSFDENGAGKGPIAKFLSEEKLSELKEQAGLQNGDPDYRSTTKDVKKILKKFEEQGVQGVIVDLRNNGGGVLQTATKIADELLAQNQMIVYTAGRTRKKATHYATNKGNLESTEVVIDEFEFLLPRQDDPETADVDESELFTKANPGIRVQLDTTFFANNILRKEGGLELLSQANFNEFLRGIHLSIVPQAENHYLLLDIRQATISLTYEYDKVDTNGTAQDRTDDEVVTEESTFNLTLLRGDANGNVTGNAVNTFIKDNLPAEIENNLDTPENASRIYLKGAGSTYAELNLFDEVNGRIAINEIKTNKWVINQANLVFYVDRATLDAAGGGEEPPRLYLYNAETNQPLFDASLDQLDQANSLTSFPLYGGLLDKDASDKGVKYTVGITSHINNLIVNDSTNATLGLTITPDIRSTGAVNAMLSNNIEKELPVISTISPLGTVLFGSQEVPGNEGMKLKLEIAYTKAN